MKMDPYYQDVPNWYLNIREDCFDGDFVSFANFVKSQSHLKWLNLACAAWQDKLGRRATSNEMAEKQYQVLIIERAAELKFTGKY